MPDFLISSGKNVADFPYLFQKLRFRISHLLLERVSLSQPMGEGWPHYQGLCAPQHSSEGFSYVPKDGCECKFIFTIKLRSAITLLKFKGKHAPLPGTNNYLG